jgi:hypothetical protein
MDKKKLDIAIEEAERFLKKAKSLRDLTISDEKRIKMAKEKGDYYWVSSNPKESGAVRRASMDLTRALADLRRY